MKANLALAATYTTLLGVTVFALCMRCLNYVNIKESVGFLLATIQYCLSEVTAFLGVLAMAILSFGLMFHLYFLNDAYVQL